ncbi:MAG: hypothetical protein ABJA87_12865 [bacterium]
MKDRRPGPGADEDELPLVDVHAIRIHAEPSVVWTALARMLTGRARTMGLVAPMLRAEPRRTAGDPLRTGSTVPGFAVVHSEPPTWLTLRGRHTFSRYQLTFRLSPDAGATEVRAETRASFLGAKGRVYRALVIGSGGHTHAVQGMLTELARRSRPTA